MEKYKKLFSTTAIFGVSTILSKIVLSLLLPLYTRFLTTAQYGTAEIITSISQLLIPVCSLSIQEGIFRFGMDSNHKREDVLKTASVVSTGAILGLLICSMALNLYAPVAEWKWMFFWVSVFTMTRTQLSLYVKAIDKTTIFAIDNVVYNLSLGIFNVILLAVFKMELHGYFVAMIAANCLSITYMFLAARLLKDLKIGSADITLLKAMLVYSAPLILNSISWGITHLTDKVMLTSFCSSDATGLYSAASKVPSILSLVTGVFCQAWTLSAIKDYQEEKDTRFYENIFFITHLGVVMISLVVFAFNNNVLLWIIGNDFAESVIYIPVLIIATVFLTYANFYTPIYSAAKRSKQLMYSSFFGMLINVILNALLIPKSGIMGACVATAISYGFIAIFRAMNSRYYMRFDIQPFKWAASLILVCFVGILTIHVQYEIAAAITAMAIVVLLYHREVLKVFGRVIHRR